MKTMKFLRHNGTHHVLVESKSKEYAILKKSFNDQTELLDFIPGCMFIVTNASLGTMSSKNVFCEFQLEFVGYDEKGI